MSDETIYDWKYTTTGALVYHISNGIVEAEITKSGETYTANGFRAFIDLESAKAHIEAFITERDRIFNKEGK